MLVSELREQIAHAEHMVRVRPEGPDKAVAKTFLALANPMLSAVENQVVPNTEVPRRLMHFGS